VKFPVELAQLQSNTYTCGPATLRHALLCYGVRRSIRALARMCGTSKQEGTSPRELERVAKELGFTLAWSTWHSAAGASAEMLRCLRAHEPVLLCVDKDSESGAWAHWIVVVGATARTVTIVDSSRPGPAVRRISWKLLMRRLAVFERDGVNRYDLYPLLEAA
jgi:ABC-type bacteriocin/lantibiotic exporter with double-glycine peptidase domain